MEFKRDVPDAIGVALVPPPEDFVTPLVTRVLETDAALATASMTAAQDNERIRQMDEGFIVQKQVDAAAKLNKDPSNPADDAEVAQVAKELKKNADGSMQGATTLNQSLVNQELILKRAISKRPWLRDRFIEASTSFLGVDVYQRGYMAQLDSERALLEQADAADKEALVQDNKHGEELMKGNFIQAYLAANPNSAVAEELYGMTPAQVSQFYKSQMGTPQLRAAVVNMDTVKSSSIASDYYKNTSSLQEAEMQAKFGKTNSEFAADFGEAQKKILTDPTFFSPTGEIVASEKGRMANMVDALKSRVLKYRQDALAQNFPPDKVEQYVNIQLAAIEGVQGLLANATSSAITKEQITQIMQGGTLSALTDPSVASVVSSLMAINPNLDPAMAQSMAMLFSGRNNTMGSRKLVDNLEINGGTVSTMLRQAVGASQSPSTPESQRSLHKDNIRRLSNGVVLNLSAIDPKDLAKSFSATTVAYSQLRDFADAMLAPDKAGGKDAYFDSLSTPDKYQIGGAFAKSLYVLQTSLVMKTGADSELAAFRQKLISGEPPLRYRADGGITVTDPSAYTSPREKAFLREIEVHNQMIKDVRAQEILTKTLGRTPTINDRDPALKSTYSADRLGAMSTDAISASRSYTFGENTPGKSQGAKAPTGTLAYDPTNRDSVIAYATGLRGAESAGSFDVVYGGEKVPVTSMTVGQVLAYQEARKASGKQTAIGAYQFTADTLKSAMDRAGVSEKETFSIAVQNKIMKSHTDYLAEKAKAVLGRAPSFGELYLLHFQGEGDGAAMLAAGPSASLDNWMNEKEKKLNPQYAKAGTVGGLIALLNRKFA